MYNKINILKGSIMTTDDLLMEMREEMKGMNKEIHLMSQTLAKLASIENRIDKLEDNIKDYQVIKSKVTAMVWGLSVIYVSLIGYIATNLK